MQANKKWNKIILQDALYVPELHGNLLSVSALAKRGAHVQFSGKTCEIRDRADYTICTGQLDDNLYIVQAQPFTPESARITYADPLPSDSDNEVTESEASTLIAHSKGASADICTWYCRLGHIGIDSVLQMVSKGMVKGMAITGNATHDALGICEPCIKGKHARQSINKSTKTHTNTILGRVFSDLCGPMQT